MRRGGSCGATWFIRFALPPARCREAGEEGSQEVFVLNIRGHYSMAKHLRVERKTAGANKARRAINLQAKTHGKLALRHEAQRAIQEGLEELYA